MHKAKAIQQRYLTMRFSWYLLNSLMQNAQTPVTTLSGKEKYLHD